MPFFATVKSSLWTMVNDVTAALREVSERHTELAEEAQGLHASRQVEILSTGGTTRWMLHLASLQP